MPLPVKAILTKLAFDIDCPGCGRSSCGFRVEVFLETQLARPGSVFCLNCLDIVGEVVGELELEDLAPQRTPCRPRLRRQKRLSQQQELDIALELSAVVQKASGALPGLKGDGRRKGVLRFEAKYTEAGSYTLKLSDLEKIASECHGRERPVLVLDFKERGTGKLRDRFAVVRFDDAKEMFNAAGHDR